MAQTQHDANVYYVPHHSPWPFFGSITLFALMVGVANWFNGHAWGYPLFLAGVVGTLLVLFAWFRDVIGQRRIDDEAHRHLALLARLQQLLGEAEAFGLVEVRRRHRRRHRRRGVADDRVVG